MKRLLQACVIVASGFSLGGCLFGGDDDNPSSPSVTLSFAAKTGSAPGAIPGNPVTSRGLITDGQTTIEISRARILLREVEFKRQDDVLGVNPEEVEAGPTVVELDLAGAATQVVVRDIPASSYDEIEFILHKLDPDDSRDAAAIAADATGRLNDFLAGDRYSVIVEGMVNGVDFTFRGRFNAEQKIELVSPLVVNEASSDVRVTVTVDLNLWFRTQDSAGLPDPQGLLLDPSDEQNESVFEENIKESFEGFEDDDRDGEADA